MYYFALQLGFGMLIIVLLSLITAARAADFDASFSYAQSRDFWHTVQDIQNRTGNLPEINGVIKDKFGKPDILYSYLDASYQRPQDWMDNSLFTHFSVGTHAEALAGGEVTNPISPEIQAYADSIGIMSFGLQGLSSVTEGSSLQSKVQFGLGPEKRLYAHGAEFLDAIPVRTGMLILAGLDNTFLHRNAVGDDFWISTEVNLRATYFHSSVTPVAKIPEDKTSFTAVRWKIQNEWLKEVETPISNRTQLGLISVLGQDPVPYLRLPVTWDYQQKLKLYPGFSSIGGLGGLVRLVSDTSLPTTTFYGGIFSGSLGAGLDLQFGKIFFSAATFSLENGISVSRDSTRIWNASLGMAL